MDRVPARTGEERLLLPDLLRGFLLVNMVCYHGMYDLVYLKGVSVPWFPDTPGYVWQQCICWGFILLSGFCWSLSRRRLYHGLLLTACGAVITLATWLVMPSESIFFGVLTLLGLSALLLIPLDRLFVRTGFSAAAGLVLSCALFFVTKGVPRGYLGFEGIRLLELPSSLYVTDLAAVLGFPSPTFRSSDYFPLIPWLFLYLAGYFLNKILFRREKAAAFLRGKSSPLLEVLAFPGRHSLVIYLLHQPLLLALFQFL